MTSSDERTEPTRGTRRRTIRIAIVGVAAVVVAAIVLFLSLPGTPPTLDDSDAGAPPASESPAPLSLAFPTPAPLGEEPEAESAITIAAETLVAASNEVLQRADGGTEGLDAVATGFVEGEVEALAIERERMGYRQVGDAVVTNVTVRSMDLTTDPPTAVLEVCIDTGSLDVVDPNGTSVADQLYQPGHPVLHLYGAVFTDGLWRLSTHEIPDGAACA